MKHFCTDTHTHTQKTGNNDITSFSDKEEEKSLNEEQKKIRYRKGLDCCSLLFLLFVRFVVLCVERNLVTVNLLLSDYLILLRICLRRIILSDISLAQRVHNLIEFWAKSN